MPLEVRKPSPLDSLDMLVYGKSGVGKTVFSGTAQNDERTSDVLVLDVEGGTRSLAGMDIDVVPISGYQDLLDVTEWLNRYIFALNRLDDDEKLEEVWSELHGDEPVREYNTVVIDSLTEVQEYILERALEERTDDELAQYQVTEWNLNNKKMKDFVQDFIDFDINVIMTALPRETRDEKTNEQNVVPDLAGKLQNEVPGRFDVVSFMYTKNNGDSLPKRYLLLKDDGLHLAKVRDGVAMDIDVPQYIEDPDVSKVMDLITGVAHEEDEE